MIFYLFALNEINSKNLLSKSKENKKETEKQEKFIQHFHNQFLQNQKYFQQDKLAWSDFFQGTANKQIFHKETGENVIPTESNNYIVYSYFYGTSTTEDGGAIRSDKADANYLIESSSFFHCYAANSGGAISLYIPAEIYLHKICGNSCSVGNNINFANCYLYWKDASFHNYFLSSSITGNTGYGYTTDHQYGQIMHSECNFTYNTGNYASVIFDQPAQNGINQYGIIKYTTLSNNTSEGHAILMCDRPSPSTYQIESSNIVYNKQAQIGYSLLYFISDCTISNTCITNNDCSSIFQNTNGVTTFYNCTIDPAHFNNVIGNINTQNLGPFNSPFYNYYTYIQNDVCHIRTHIYRTAEFKTPFKQLHGSIIY